MRTVLFFRSNTQNKNSSIPEIILSRVIFEWLHCSEVLIMGISFSHCNTITVHCSSRSITFQGNKVGKNFELRNNFSKLLP